MDRTNSRDAAPKPPTFLRGTMFGVLVLMADAVGLWALNSPVTRLGSMKADLNLGLLTDVLGNSQATALSLFWTSLSVVVPSVYLARRRYLRGLAGMLLVSVTALSAFLVLLFLVFLLRNTAATTG